MPSDPTSAPRYTLYPLFVAICALAVVSIGPMRSAHASNDPGTAGAPIADGEAGEAHDISWRWPARAVRYDMVRSTTDTIRLNGNTSVTKQIAARVVEHGRISRDETGLFDRSADETAERPVRARVGQPEKVRVRWREIRFEQDDSLNEPLRYDSSDPDDWMMTRHPVIGSVASSLGTSLVLEIAPDGALRGIGGLEAYVRGIETNLTEWGLVGEGAYQTLKAIYTEETLKASARGTYRFLPGDRLGVGDSYDVSRSFPLPYVRALQSLETHTFEGIELSESGRRIARFAIGGTLEWRDPDGLADRAFRVDLEEPVIAGAWSYDIDLGLVVSYRFEVSFGSDIVRFDPEAGSSVRASTEQTLVDTMRLLDGTEPDPQPLGKPGPGSRPAVP